MILKRYSKQTLIRYGFAILFRSLSNDLLRESHQLKMLRSGKKHAMRLNMNMR